LTVSLQKLKRQEGEEFYKEEDKWNVRADEIYDSNKILEFFNKRLSTNVPLTFPLSTILIKNITFLAIFIAFLTVLKYLRVVMLEPAVWFIIAMLTYFICTGGIVYSIIHNVPWFKMERD
jgi:ABC-type multidrug transport system fused ATPase/permease subunit